MTEVETPHEHRPIRKTLSSEWAPFTTWSGGMLCISLKVVLSEAIYTDIAHEMAAQCLITPGFRDEAEGFVRNRKLARSTDTYFEIARSNEQRRTHVGRLSFDDARALSQALRGVGDGWLPLGSGFDYEISSRRFRFDRHSVWAIYEEDAAVLADYIERELPPS